MKSTLNIINHDPIEIEYQTVEASDLLASHLPCNSFQRNPDYQYENERQYHKEAASQEAIIKMAASLNPSLLLAAPTCIDGAPVTDSDLNVLGGNCRSMAIQYAYCHGSAAAYKQAVVDFCHGNGIACDCQNPILIRRIAEPLDARKGQELISLLNDTFTAAKTAVASAYSRGTRFSQKTLQALAAGLANSETLRQFFDSVQSQEAVTLLIEDGVIQYNEKNAYINGGFLNPQGKELIEKSLRSLVAENLEQLSRIPAPILAKIDAVIPYILTTSQIQNWNILTTVKASINLLYEFVISGEKDVNLFLRKCSMLQKAAIERYSHNEIAMFNILRDSGKQELINKFKSYASQADISIENNGMGIGLAWQDAMVKFFGFEIESQIIAENEQINTNGANEMTAPKTQKNRTPKTKNDCTKQNSKLIHAVTCEKEDRSTIMDYISENISEDFSVLEISKTQAKVIYDGQDYGYRLMRSGRQWQLRLLNGHQSDPTIKEAVQQDISPSEMLPDNTYEFPQVLKEQDGSSVSIVGKSENNDFDNPNLEYQILTAKEQSKVWNEIYVICENCVGWSTIRLELINPTKYNCPAYIVKDGEVFLGKIGREIINKEFLAAMEYSYCNEYLPLPESEENLDHVTDAIIANMQTLGYRLELHNFLKKNFGGGFKGQVNPEGKRMFHIHIENGKTVVTHGVNTPITMYYDKNTNYIDFAIALDHRIIRYARATGEYDNPETLDGILDVDAGGKRSQAAIIARFPPQETSRFMANSAETIEPLDYAPCEKDARKYRKNPTDIIKICHRETGKTSSLDRPWKGGLTPPLLPLRSISLC